MRQDIGRFAVLLSVLALLVAACGQRRDERGAIRLGGRVGRAISRGESAEREPSLAADAAAGHRVAGQAG